MRRGGTADGLGGKVGRGAGNRAAPRSQNAGSAGASAKPRGRRSDIGEVLFEFWPSGRYVKVSAMHSATLTEISIVGDPKRGQAELEEIALQKLRYVLGRKPR